jgi:Ca2+-binding RTX toxin-like protein
MGVAGVAIVSITGGSGNDSIYGTASVDNVIAGNAGNDTITFAANLTSADTIDGGDGTDILSASGGIADTAFTYITSVETLTLTSAGTTTLGAAAQAAGIVTINGSTASEIITATAYTVGLTFNGLDSSGATDSVTLGSGDDVFVYAGNLLLSSDDSLDGGAGTDTVRIDNSAGSVSISVNFATFLNIEQIVVNDTNGSATSTAESINITLTAASVTSGTVGISTISVDGSAIADASDSMNFTATGITVTSGLQVSVLGGAGNDSIVGSSNADTITGNAGNDSINGGSGADSITGGDGNDTINGETGSDVITGGAGNDSITAGDGNDNLDGGVGSDSFIFAANLASADTIGGGDGTDILSVSGGSADTAFTNITSVETLTLTSGGATTTLGTAAQAAGIVTINGSTASEIITATAYTVGLTFNGLDSSGATDSVTLGSGDDVFVYAGNLLLSSDDSLNGGAGTDTVRIDNSAGSVSISVDFAKFVNIEQIVVFDSNGSATSTAESINITLTAAAVTTGAIGISTILVDGSAITDAADSMNFTAAGMVVATNGLKVSVLGGAGNDTIVGSTAADTLTGNAGNDSINGGSGADSITGGDGNDTINGETGNDVITGGAGNDSITAAVGNDNLNGGDGSDTLIIADNLSYEDTIAGGDGVDILSLSETVTDIDFLNVSGIETLTLASAGTTVTLGAYAQAAGITTINGHTGNDIISATAYTVGLTFNGLDSSGATDSVTLGTGDDIFVFAGNLLLSSDDSLNGGAGTDTVRIDNSAGSVSISVDFAKFVNIEQIVVYDSNGTATGTAESINITLTVASVTTGAIGISTISVDGSAITDAADSMNFTAAGMVVDTNGLKVSVLGGAGNDTIIGSTGADTISGGDGNDSLTGGSGADSITGGAGTDALIGQTGNDVLVGGDGNDTLTGATGNDTLTGGAGNDTFALAVAGTTKLVYDTITDLGVGDILSFTGAVGSASTTFTSTALSTTNLSWTELVNIAASGNGSVTANFSWFSWGGNTYVVQDYSSASSFVDGTDIIVEITGAVSLQASFAATSAGASTIVIS